MKLCGWTLGTDVQTTLVGSDSMLRCTRGFSYGPIFAIGSSRTPSPQGEVRAAHYPGDEFSGRRAASLEPRTTQLADSPWRGEERPEPDGEISRAA